VTALVLLDADCIMTCPAIVPTAQLGVLFEMQKHRGSQARLRARSAPGGKGSYAEDPKDLPGALHEAPRQSARAPLQ
jgi:hypothetical protein